jgi:membrane protein implicated in regulation of membrane protease activity
VPSRICKLAILAAILLPAVAAVASLVAAARVGHGASLVGTSFGWLLLVAILGHAAVMAFLWRHAHRRPDLSPKQRRDARSSLLWYSGPSGMLRYWYQYIWRQPQRSEP